jgi:hypothetical protein
MCGPQSACVVALVADGARGGRVKSLRRGYGWWLMSKAILGNKGGK